MAVASRHRRNGLASSPSRPGADRRTDWLINYDRGDVLGFIGSPLSLSNSFGRFGRSGIGGETERALSRVSGSLPRLIFNSH